MWPFRRKESDEPSSNVPSEIQEYYQAEKRERMGVAWVLAFATLAITVAVVLGLFFGGRAIYHKLAHKNTPVATAPEPQIETTPTGNSSAPPKSSTGTTPKTTPPKASSSTKSPAATKPKPATPKPSTTEPLKTNQTQKISNTGPSGTVMAFVIGSVTGFLFYELRLRQKLN